MNSENNSNETIINNVAPQETQNSKKTRHWATIFWLYFMIVMSLVLTVYHFDVLAFVNSIIVITSAIMLLNWKRNGYWLLCISGIIAMVLNIVTGAADLLDALISMLAPIVLLTFFLQIKKNGISTWEQLS